MPSSRLFYQTLNTGSDAAASEAMHTKPNATRLAHSCVTLSETKGLKYRFFAALRMTVLEVTYKVYECFAFWFRRTTLCKIRKSRSILHSAPEMYTRAHSVQ